MQEKHNEEAKTKQEILIARWEIRQAKLANLLEKCDATNGERRVDWVAGQVEWVNIKDQVLASSDMKALCSYSFVDESLMMAWANVEIGEAAVISPIPDMPDYIESCNLGDAWLYAMHLADESKADYLYRIASPRYLIFLGLSNVQTLNSAPDPLVKSDLKIETVEPAELIAVPKGSPHAFVVDLLEKMRTVLEETPNDTTYLRRHFINQGESLLENAQYLENDGANSELLRYTGHALIKIGYSFGERRFGVLPPPSLSEDEQENFVSQLINLRTTWAQTSNEYRPRIE